MAGSKGKRQVKKYSMASLKEDEYREYKFSFPSAAYVECLRLERGRVVNFDPGIMLQRGSYVLHLYANKDAELFELIYASVHGRVH